MTTEPQHVYVVSEINDSVVRRTHGYFASLQGAFGYCETEERKKPLVDSARFELFAAPGGERWLIHCFYGPEDWHPVTSDFVIRQAAVVSDPVSSAVAQSAPAETALALRDRIAETMARADGWEWAADNFARLSTPTADRYRRCADAVLAELSAADRPAEEAYRLALSAALGLGTGANWEAIRDRAEDLTAEAGQLTEASRRLLEQRQEMAAERFAWQERGDRAEARVRQMEAAASADRATVLTEGADRLARVADELADTQESLQDAFSLTRPVVRDAECWHAAARELRLLAAEERAEREAQAHLDQLADELPAATDDADLTETDVDRMMAAGVPVQIVTAPPATFAASCPDPIECGHEAALGQAQQEIRRLGLMVDEYGHGASALTYKLKRVRDLHRETCILAQGAVRPTAFTCGMCEVLDAPAVSSVGQAAHTTRGAALERAVRRIGQMADAWEQQLPEVIRTPAVVSAIRDALEPVAETQPAEAAKKPPMDPVHILGIEAEAEPSPDEVTTMLADATDPTPLRDRIAEVLAPHTDHRHGLPLISRGLFCGWTPASEVADAVLSALPAPVDRAAVLRESAESVIYEVVGDWGVDGADSAEGARAAVAKWLRAYPKCGAHAQQRIVREWDDGSELYGPWTDLPDGPAVGAQQPKEADRIVAFRSRGGRLLRCLAHTPGAVAVADGEFDAVTSDDLPDGGVCTFLVSVDERCGVDVLIPQQPTEA